MGGTPEREVADLRRRVLACVEDRLLLPEHAHVLVAVSGGPDSVCLLDILDALRTTRRPGWRLTVAHLHHGIRGPEADRDAALVRRLARERGLAAHVERVDITRIAEADGEGIEATARRIRYAFLDRIARELSADAVAVAHHADDVAETLLMRIGRGVGIWGLAAMPPARPLRRGGHVRLVRPMLTVRRAEILSYVRARPLPSAQDSTNLMLCYERNFVRHRVLPILERHTPGGCVHALLALHETALSASDALHRRTEPLWTACRRLEDGALLIPPDQWRAAPHLLRKFLLKRAAEEVAVQTGPAALTGVHYDQAAALEPALDVGRALSLPGHLILRVEHDGLLLCRRTVEEPPRPGPLPVTLDQPTPLPCFALTLLPRQLPSPPDPVDFARRRGGPMTAVLDADTLPGPLRIRCRRPGDRFHPLGAPGTRKLQDFFVDEKVPARRRDRLPLLTTGEGEAERIVWVIGHRIAHPFRCRPDTRNLLILHADRLP